MKKHVIFLFFGIFSCVCFAQDFRDTYWDMDMTNLARGKNVKALSAEEMIEKAYMLGEHTRVSYFFYKNQLKAAGYDVSYSEKKLIDLKNNLTKKYGSPNKIIRFAVFEKDAREELKQKTSNSEDTYAYLMYDDIFRYHNGGGAVLGYILDNENKSTEQTAISFMHYKTAFSDIYVYADVFPDRIVVLYKKHVDDF